jgi:hypothetical protein
LKNKIVSLEQWNLTLETKMDSILSQLENKELSINLDGKEIAYDTLKIGALSDIPDDVLKRFSLGPYSKTNTPGSTSL